MGLLDRLRRAVASAPHGVEAELMPGVICSPVSGRVLSMGEVPDPVFSSGMMGLGCAVWPEDDVVYAPLSGVVRTVMSHAVGLRSDEGVEVLVHIGIDTVEMRGEGFEMFVRPNDRVLAGQPLARVDRAKIRAAGHPDCVVVAVTNSDDYDSVAVGVASGRNVRAGLAIAEVVLT